MIYRAYGNTGKKVSVLGFGCMRLPMIGVDEHARVDDEKAIPLIRAAYDAGINYFDTAWIYNRHDSQRALGRALHDVRDKVYIATKLPCFLVKERDDFWKYLFASIERLDTDHIDFFHLHSYNAENHKSFMDIGLFSAAERALSKGYIGHLSFSSHSNPEILRQFIDTGLFSTMLCQYNLVNQVNEEVMAYAASKGVGVAVMGPNAGGMLIRGGDDFVRRVGSDAANPAEMALRFVWGNPTVSVALSGMESMEALRQNVGFAESADEVSPSEREKLIAASDELKKADDLHCTGCNYCNVCPRKIRISNVFKAYLYHKVWGLTQDAKTEYGYIGTDPWFGAYPSECTACGACAARCPQGIDIPAELKRVTGILEAL